jgi:hypothetical protein
LPPRLVALPLLLLAGHALFAQDSFAGNTPVTVGEGSILITTDARCPFAVSSRCWQIADGADSFSKSSVIQTRDKKLWKKVKVGPKGGSLGIKDDCTKKDNCQIVATFSDGTTITLSQTAKGKGIRLASSRVLGDYTADSAGTSLEFIGTPPVTLLSVNLIKTQGSQTQLVDLCKGVSRCQVSLDHEP